MMMLMWSDTTLVILRSFPLLSLPPLHFLVFLYYDDILRLSHTLLSTPPSLVGMIIAIHI